MDKVKEILEKQLQLLSEQEDVKVTHDMCEIAMVLYLVEVISQSQNRSSLGGRASQDQTLAQPSAGS